MLTSIIIAIEYVSLKGIEFAEFGMYKGCKLSTYNVRTILILESKTFISTHLIKSCEACLYRAIPTILASPNGL